MREERQCPGCGVHLQSTDPQQPGYVPAQRQEEREVVWCQRCFRIRHYQEMKPVAQSVETYLQKLSTIADQKALVIQIVDLFDFIGSLIEGLPRYMGQNPLLVIGNKMDLFPASIKEEKVREWVWRQMEDAHLHPIDVIIGSAQKGDQVDAVMQAIEHYRRGRDVYVIGMANVGKSTWVNRMLQKNGIAAPITTSPYPGTTLDWISFLLDDGQRLIDTPGLLRPDRITERLDAAELKLVLPKVEIKPKVYQLNARQTLFLGGLARFDFVRGERQSFVFYCSNRLPLHRTKMEKAAAFFEKHAGQLLSPPRERFTQWKKYSFSFDGRQKQEIEIAGLGFISAGTKAAKIDVHVPTGIYVGQRNALI